jgi:hypothetical protein
MRKDVKKRQLARTLVTLLGQSTRWWVIGLPLWYGRGRSVTDWALLTLSRVQFKAWGLGVRPTLLEIQGPSSRASTYCNLTKLEPVISINHLFRSRMRRRLQQRGPTRSLRFLPDWKARHDVKPQSKSRPVPSRSVLL